MSNMTPAQRAAIAVVLGDMFRCEVAYANNTTNPQRRYPILSALADVEKILGEK